MEHSCPTQQLYLLAPSDCYLIVGFFCLGKFYARVNWERSFTKVSTPSGLIIFNGSKMSVVETLRKAANMIAGNPRAPIMQISQIF